MCHFEFWERTPCEWQGVPVQYNVLLQYIGRPTKCEVMLWRIIVGIVEVIKITSISSQERTDANTIVCQKGG